MSVKNKILSFIDSQEFLAHVIALILSTLFIGFAPSSIAVGIFIFFAIRYSIIHGGKQKIDPKLLIPVTLYLFFTLSILWTVDDEQTRKGIDRTVVLLCIPIAFNLIPKFDFKSFDLIMTIFTKVNIVFGFFFLLSSCFRYYKSNSLSSFTYHDLVSDLDLNAIHVSVIFIVSLFYLLSKKTKTIYDILMIVFLSALLILLSSKTILAVLIFGFLFYVISNRVRKTKLILAILIGTTIVAFAAKKSYERVLFEKETKVKEVWTKQKFGDVYLWTGTSIRLLQLRILKEQLREEKIFWKGFGLFASKDNIKKRHEEFKTYPSFHSYNYHNQYAQILSETGIIGLVLLLSMLFVLFKEAYNSKNYLFFMFSITIATVFFTESLLWRQSGLFIFVILYCLLNRTQFKTLET